MTRQEIETKIAELRQELERLELKTVWDLEEGDECIILNDYGDVDSSEWCDDEFSVDMREQGNIFLTKEEAELERDRRAFRTKEKKAADKAWRENREERIVWCGKSQKKWYWYVDNSYGRKIGIDSACVWQNDLTYFPSKASLEAFLTEENKAEILRIWGAE